MAQAKVLGRVPHPVSLATLCEHHDTFLIDQFGTLHDGARAYPGARDALERLRKLGRKLVVLSNSGRRAAPNAARLARLGFPADCYDLLITSGEVGWEILRARRQAGTARRVLLLTRDNDAAVLEGTGLVRVAAAEAAELVVIGGSEAERYPLAHYESLLRPAAERDVPAICLNPDRIMLVGDLAAPGAGRIAELYAAMGGKVEWIGKPHPAIYAAALQRLGAPSPARVIGIGDSVEHDVAGAQAAGCAGALVRTGIIAGQSDAEIAAECARHGAWPDAVLARFAWEQGARGGDALRSRG